MESIGKTYEGRDLFVVKVGLCGRLGWWKIMGGEMVEDDGRRDGGG